VGRIKEREELTIIIRCVLIFKFYIMELLTIIPIVAAIVQIIILIVFFVLANNVAEIRSRLIESLFIPELGWNKEIVSNIENLLKEL
jgi:hypothetical protein